MLSSGCATQQVATAPNEKLCDDWQDWLIEKGDVISEGTGKRIIGNNEARRAWCQGKRA